MNSRHVKLESLAYQVICQSRKPLGSRMVMYARLASHKGTMSLREWWLSSPECSLRGVSKPQSATGEELSVRDASQSAAPAIHAATTRFPSLAVIGIAVMLLSATCVPKSTPSPEDAMKTSIAFGVSVVRTLTAEAPSPQPTGTATETPFPVTNTPYYLKNPVVNKLAPCWFGPGRAYNLESNIKEGESVEMVAVGSVPGWYIIINPYYYQPCWIKADDLDMDPMFKPSLFPLITPYRPEYPQPTHPGNEGLKKITVRNHFPPLAGADGKEHSASDVKAGRR